MISRLGILSVCLILWWPSACILPKDCLTKKKDLDATVDQLIRYEKELEKAALDAKKAKTEYDKCQQLVRRLELDYRSCNEGQDMAQGESGDQKLQSRYQELEKINANLSDKVKNLKIEIQKRDSIIAIQDDVIRVLDDTKKTIETNLKEQIAKKLFEIETTKNRLRMVIQDTILFKPGSMMINANGKKVLQKIAASVRENLDQHIRVEGHTDNLAPQNRYSSNWELSAARAIAVIQFLEAYGLDPAKLSAVAYGANRPVATNDTQAGRLQNRRIELVLYYMK